MYKIMVMTDGIEPAIIQLEADSYDVEDYGDRATEISFSNETNEVIHQLRISARHSFIITETDFDLYTTGEAE